MIGKSNPWRDNGRTGFVEIRYLEQETSQAGYDRARRPGPRTDPHSKELEHDDRHAPARDLRRARPRLHPSPRRRDRDGDPLLLPGPELGVPGPAPRALVPVLPATDRPAGDG